MGIKIISPELSDEYSELKMANILLEKHLKTFGNASLKFEKGKYYLIFDDDFIKTGNTLTECINSTFDKKF